MGIFNKSYDKQIIDLEKGIMINVHSIDDLKTMFKKIASEISDHDLEIQRMKSHMISLRGFVNRNKLPVIEEEEKVKPKEEESEDIKRSYY